MSGKSYLLNKNFHKHNYFDAFKYIVPGYIYEDDRNHSPKDDDLADVVINSNIDIANNISTIINVSSVAGGSSENVNTLNGITPYFVKQNNLTNITTQDFEDNILLPLTNKRFGEFTTIESFSSFVDGTLIPATKLNNPQSLATSTPAQVHNYLVTNNSWLYFLNTTGTYYDPSSYVSDLIVNKLFKGKKVTTSDGVQGITEYVYRNELTDFYPNTYFASGARADLSGAQQLEKLKTWVDILYSPLYADNSDFRVRDKFLTFIDGNIKTSRKVEDGPFTRFLRALSFLAYDIDNLSEQLTTNYDLEDCPDEYLPLLAKLIGWDLFGVDPDRWRLQLRNATNIYKAVGTSKAVQFALNTVFPKDQFPIQTSLVELWESYVPYLIYYALATESEYFKDYSTWTPDLALRMGVLGYSTSSMDENLSRATDRIIFETYTQFSGAGNFNIPNQEDGFFYRGNVNAIPPYEEYPYYVNVELTKEMIYFIADRLACFGVRNDFALDFVNYLTEYGLDSNDEPRDGSWLLFTSGYNNPPNFSDMITGANSKNAKYISLWSGKSSHFKLALNSTAYDFTKKGLITPDTGDAVVVASKMVRKFAPAHSIPLISLDVDGDIDNTYYADNFYLPLVTPNLKEDVVASNNNYQISGLFLGSYKRGYQQVGDPLTRKDTRSAVSPRILNASSIADLPRRSTRRRNFQNAMPKHGYFDRTGFNMPSILEMDGRLSGTAEGQGGAIPLGYNPSSGGYTPVSSHINLPAIWKQCEDLDSVNSYYGYNVNATMPARGRAFYLSSVYNDRGKLADIYKAMHSISEREKYVRVFAESGPPAIENQIRALQSQGTLDQFSQESLENLLDQLNLLPDWYWTNAANAGSNTNLKGYTFPASVDDYYNFEFGRDLHRLYRIYVEDFHQHGLTPRLIGSDGPTLFSHTYGPLLFNHDFDLLYGDAGIGSIITSSISDVKELTPGKLPFNSTSSYEAVAASDMIVEKPEFVFSGLVKGVELIHTSGTKDDESSFSVFRISKAAIKEGDDPYMFGKTFILTKADTGSMPRVRMDISKSTLWDEGYYDINENFLMPNHDFELSLDSLVSDNTGRNIGGRSLGVWIHTKPEGDKMWSYTAKGEWLNHSTTITRKQLLESYGHLFKSPVSVKPLNNPELTELKCLDVVAKEIKSPVTKLSQNDFTNHTIKFNTRNRQILESKDYKVTYGDLHRKDQKYVVEVFLLPAANDSDTFMLFDSVSIKDLTMNKLSERHVTGPKANPLQELVVPQQKGIETRMEVTQEELLEIFKYFNKLSGKGETTSHTSRDDTKSEAIMGRDGGSKLSYRYLTTFFKPKFQEGTLDEIKIYEGGGIT
jgi:hypothetical protein